MFLVLRYQGIDILITAVVPSLAPSAISRLGTISWQLSMSFH